MTTPSDAAAPAWLAWCERVAVFVHTNGRMPRARNRTIPDDEGQLGAWVARQRAADRAGLLSAEQRESLDTALPGWTQIDHSGWHAQLGRLHDFYLEHGRLPKGHRAHVGRAEAAVAAWLVQQRGRSKAGALSQGQRDALDAGVPDWDGPRSPQWADWVALLEVFVDEHGRMPRVRGSTVPAAEARLGLWLQRQRRKYRASTLSPEHALHFEAAYPGWDTDTGRLWRTNAAAVAAFVTERGRWPRKTNLGVPVDESRLGNWVVNQRVLAKMGRLSSDRQSTIDRLLPGWFTA